MDSEDDFLALAKSDISQLCGELVWQWKQFLDNVNSNRFVGKYLARVHHFYRVRISYLIDKKYQTICYRDLLICSN